MTPHTGPSRIQHAGQCQIAVIWIDWYPYHLARFNGLQSAAGINEVAGIELVGGIGVHTGLQFREDRPDHLRIETLRPNSDWHNVSKLGLSITLFRALSRLNPQVVLIPGYYTLPAFAAMAWTKLHRRTSVLMTETAAIDHLRIPWKERLKSTVIRTMFDWAVTGGVAHVRYLQQLGFPSDRIAHFYDVVCNERIRTSTEALRKSDSPQSHGLPQNYFLFVGRLAEEKNVRGLVEAWLNYREKGGVWSLVLAGDGPERDAISSLLAESPHRDDVRFMGHRSSRELIPCFAFARCFVLPSTREPWGLVVNEAMASSLPVIVSKKCGCVEDLVIDRVNGLIFDPEEDGALVNCLQKISSLASDQLPVWGTRSAHRIASYTPRDFGEQISRILTWSKVQRAKQAASQRSLPAPGHSIRADRPNATPDTAERVG
ncbi:MAG: glycosyltransferase [Edaphobacter sp.]|uniref:glycosyltransferase n=1 Tax=Edaphobacter sp. TaxID=1934404 RepID=UPI0023A6BB8F|nr:glycosyltransferase [Edaphobacter sp.]MDE1175573.1 glycosyltransferase [Edaphobacter sp.]